MIFANSLNPDQADKMLGLIWIQTDTDGVEPEITFWKNWFWKKSADDKKKIMKNYQACKELMIFGRVAPPYVMIFSILQFVKEDTLDKLYWESTVSINTNVSSLWAFELIV